MICLKQETFLVIRCALHSGKTNYSIGFRKQQRILHRIFTCNSSGQLVGSLDGGFLVVDVEVNHVYVSIAVEGGGRRGRGTLDTTFCKVKLSEYPSSAREATDL